MANKWVNDDALLFFGSQFKTKIEEQIPTKTSDITNDSNFVSDANYVHTDNNYTATEKSKLAGIAEGAQVNIIESVKVNGTALTVTSKAVDVSVPTATSDLTNDSGFITSADVPEGATASTSAPLMDGTAAVGTSTAFARGDHVHPSDTSKVDVSTFNTAMAQATTALNTKLSINGSYIDDDTGNILSANLANDANPQTSFEVLSSTGISMIYARKDEYVHKETGKGLSTNDFTNAEKNKLAAFSAASDYALKTDITNMYKYKGSVATVSALPSSGNTTGDVYDVQENGMNYAWNGSAWDALGEIFSITAISNAEITSIVDQVFAS